MLLYVAREQNKYKGLKYMKKILLYGVFLLNFLNIYSMSIYSGDIHGNKINMFLNLYSDGVGNGVYSYEKYGIPISFDLSLKDSNLYLKGQNEEIILSNFDSKNNDLTGKWRKDDKILKVNLKKQLEFNSYDDTEFKNLKFLVSSTTKNEFFKLILEKRRDEDTRVIGVNIYSKTNKKLLQSIKLDCAFIGPLGVSVGDYNFDGVEDFSVFEAYYAGPNTSSIYILKDKKKDKFFISSFQGSSLEFDYEKKKVYSHNQTQAGASHLFQEFIVKNNQLILKKETTLNYDDTLDDFIEKTTNF